MQNGIENVLSRNPLIPVVKMSGAEDVIRIGNELGEQGIYCVEITLRTEFAWEAIQQFKEQFGDTFEVGVGTIVNSEQIAKAREVGVDFLVSPGCTSHIAQQLEHSGISFLPGVSTPSEIMRAMEFGWRYFKFFPANLFGGIKALSTYGAVFQEAKFCPTGGISESNYPDFLALDNVCAVGGSWIIK